MFNLGDKVKTKAIKNDRNYGNSPAGKGTIVGMYLLNGVAGGDAYYQVNIGQGTYNYSSDSMSLCKVQVLHAYKDATDEVHWSTRKYDAKERANFGFQEAFEFNKTIDLE